MALSYAFSPDKGETPETIAQRRQMSNLIAARMLGAAPKNVGEGLNAIGQALIARSMMGDADAAQKAGMASLPDFLKSQITGQPATPSAAPSVSTPMGATSIPAGNTEFVNTVMPLAQQASEKTGIDPRLITAQAILETGYGKSAPGNNLFGIKSHGQPGGNVLPTTEVVNGQPVKTTDSFMSYASPADSANGYADFINKNPRYAAVKSASGLEAQADALGQSGYATDPNYGKKILQIARGLPAPTGGVLADNSLSPLDNAQFPAGPVGSPQLPTGAASADIAAGGPAVAPAAVQPAAAPQNRFLFKNASDEDLQKALLNPFTPENVRAALTQEYKLRADAAQKAADPMRALDMQSKQLGIKKAQQDLDKSDFEWKPIGRDANGEWAYGFVNSKTGEVRDRFNNPIQQQQQPTEDPTAGLAGEDYLKAIPRDRADLARKVANGEIDVASLPNRGNYRMQVLSDAARFDPTFNPSDYKTRLATRKDFTSGKSAQNITSFNTAIGHLDTLDKAVDPLGNSSSSLYNKITAPISEQTDPKYQVALKNFRTAKQAVADELARAFKGAGGTVHDISEWEKTINSADSPAALHAAVKQAVELLHSRINAIGDQYNRGMGKTTDPVSLLSPKAKATLERLEGGATEQPTGPVTINGYKIEAVD